MTTTISPARLRADDVLKQIETVLHKLWAQEYELERKHHPGAPVVIGIVQVLQVIQPLLAALDAVAPRVTADVKGIDAFVDELHREVYTPVGIKTVLLAFAAHVTRQAQAPSGWRPMADAPKDGTEVMLLGQSGVDMGHWEKELVAPRECGVPTECDLEAGWHGFKDFYTGEHMPSGWQPLPAPPEPGR